MKLKDENQTGKITGQHPPDLGQASRGYCVEWVYLSFIESFTVFFNSNFLLVFLNFFIGEE
jgi:hypothetical protein